jgi:hypothetical protein
MSASKATIPLVATMMVLLMGVILYPQGSANAETYCAKPVGAMQHPTAHFRTSKIVARA